MMDSSILQTLAVLYVLYLLGLIIYRLYFSPLAKFPGPKLAACSKWYEFYYDVILRGQFTFQIQRMHQKYGPIVRINPFELHIQDSTFWDELYTKNKEYERYAWMSGRFGANTTTSSTVKSDLHATRRAPLNPMFSKRSITEFEPIVHEKVGLLSKRLAEYAKNGEVLEMNSAFNAFAGDVISSYCFGFSFDQLKSSGFKDNFHAAYEAVRKFAHFGLQFPVVFIILGLSPRAMLKLVVPNIYKMFVLQKDLQSKISAIIQDHQGNPEDIDSKSSLNTHSHPTIFDELLRSKLPPSEKTVRRLGSEAQQMIGAGVETVAWALTTTVFYLLSDHACLDKLRAELKAAIPDPANLPSSTALEKLPYLSACVKEGIRLSTGVSVRLPRVSPHKPIVYGGWVIPPIVPVSMTTLDVLRDPEVFTSPNNFIPERWLGSPKVANTGESLAKYFVPFGKGPRMCIGINLAYVEMHLTLAMLFRRFTFELYETDVSDVEIKHDFMVPQPKLSTKGVRAKVTGLVVE
uniref:Cytochrome P450 monooxygenase sdnE n=1 Tax=Sordaria araneosa TaxID=573841 RepID=SDNE_SORAA|nr:RecName: Full=Cytochrome P450 monooxygenase sdnE; AltName: Full=Sordarin/hypoxysordarin biosynthesis cluster protein E [Sordaria araneosa]BAV32149.1 cytochrome P450 monooxygenase [Sordaria araneosa]